KRLLKLPSLKNIRGLEKVSKQLVEVLTKMTAGDKALVKISEENELLQLAISATEFRMRDQNFKLVSFQNIQSELEEKELEAWQQLIRVLTHEIMNSVTPIASLASTLNETIHSEEHESGEQLSEESRKDIRGGLMTIQKRSEGLLHFVDAYRGLTRIPTPDFKIFSVRELLEGVEKLMQPQIDEKRITCCVDVIPSDLKLTADSELVEQILINIFKNAIEAMNGQPQGKIELTSCIDNRGHVIIQVIDNGPGIPEDVCEKVFIPFFTTKEQGSGIGLSLSRQIMRLHRGTISVQSKPGTSTVFTLRF
ncbi:MAG: PAS domain-containing sensor histidine kinase, partial [bacterium]